MILVVDHYDSFTYNLVQLIERVGRTTEVVKSDEEPAAELVAHEPEAVVLSPGPGHPRRGMLPGAPRLLPAATPVLGVCLGHQALGLRAAGPSIGRRRSTGRRRWSTTRAAGSSRASPARSRRGDITPWS